MNKSKATTEVTVEKAVTEVSKVELSKHDEIALKQANTNTKNDGSHIENQRNKLTANAAKTK